MPVVPKNFAGLTTALADIWIEKVVELEAEEDSSEMELIIIICSAVVGTIILCCIGYCVIVCCAKRAHKVTYLDDMKGDKGKGIKAVPAVTNTRRGEIAPDPTIENSVDAEM